MRVVQVSDVHLGMMAHREVLSPIVSRITEAAPDVLLATGDVVDAQPDYLNGLEELWRRVDPPLGKFAIFGNHEYYAGAGNSTRFLTDSGVITSYSIHYTKLYECRRY